MDEVERGNEGAAEGPTLTMTGAGIDTSPSVTGTVAGQQSGRDLVFISHANPEDNMFAEWLALRLIREGYPVWCDLLRLRGGQDIWKVVEETIRQKTAKFLYVLSRTSNVKEGTLMELSVARRVGQPAKDFIIPLRLDDIPFGEINIELNRLLAIDFSQNWATGLPDLLTKLQEDGVQRRPAFTPDAVTQWWRDRYNPVEGVRREAEEYASNWIEIDRRPDRIFLHWLAGVEPDKIDSHSLSASVQPFKRGMFSFADSAELAPGIAASGGTIESTTETEFGDFLARGLAHPRMERREARNIVSRLLRESMERYLTSRGLRPYAMSNGRRYFWFPDQMLEKNKLFFKHMDGSPGWRAVVGYKTVSAEKGQIKRLRHWHFGVEVDTLTNPILGFAILPHVVFTEGGAVYESKSQQHRARRSQCKDWYNDQWYERILATISFLRPSDEMTSFDLPLATGMTITVHATPTVFLSPLTYDKTSDTHIADEENDDFDDAGNEESGDTEVGGQ